MGTESKQRDEAIIKTWTVRGTNDDDGGPETSTVVLKPNPDWTEADSPSEYRYLVYYYIDDPKDEFELEGYDELEEARVQARLKREILMHDYVMRIEERREQRAQQLRDTIANWADGPECQLVGAVATLIEAGRTAGVLELVQQAARTSGP